MTRYFFQFHSDKFHRLVTEPCQKLLKSVKALSDRDSCTYLPVVDSGAHSLYGDHAIISPPALRNDAAVLPFKTRVHAPKTPKKQTPIYSQGLR